MRKLTPEEKERRVHERQRILYGERYVGSSLSSIRAPEWVQKKIISFIEKPTNFLVYSGSPGIGKTYLCAALTEWAFDRFNENWRYWKEIDLLAKLRNSMDTVNGDYLQVLKYMMDSEFLIIDDIGGSNKQTPWREEILFFVTDYRYNVKKPTMITSNFCQKEYLENYNPRIHSRLFSHDNVVIELPDGVDFRLQRLSDLENKIEGYKKEDA